MRKFFQVILFVSLIPFLWAQNPPAVSTYNFTLTPVSVPGLGQTVAGTEAIVGIGITQNIIVGEDTILAPGNSLQYFSGRAIWNAAKLETILNNLSPSLNGLHFQFQPTASAGVVRITNPASQHIGLTAGGIINYSFGDSGTWALGIKVEYAKFPGLKSNTWIASFGPSLHF